MMSRAPRPGRLRATVAALAVLVALPLLATPASAYEWYRARDTGEPMRWFRTELTVRVATTEPEEVPWGVANSLIGAAFDAWVDLPGCKVPQVDVVGTTTATTITTPTSLCDEPDNVVVFIRSASAWQALPNATSTQIALTFIAHNPQTGEIIDADIALNDAGFKFTTSDSGALANQSVDLLAALTHEVGHFFGLDHSKEPTATMYASYGTAGSDPRGARTLEEDDVDGICDLYVDVPDHVLPASCSGGGGGGANGCAGGGDAPNPLLALLLFVPIAIIRRNRLQPKAHRC